jgi:uncharacterized protein (TIGR03435 family)
MRNQLLVTALVSLAVVSTPRAPYAQAPPVPAQKISFEVASVKPNNSGDTGSGLSGPTPGGFTTTNAPLDWIIGYAFGVRDDQMVGLPAWVHSDRFDIVGKYPSGQPLTPSSVPGMVQALLTERFGLRTHREMREGAVYALVLARRDGKPGPKLKPNTVDCAAYLAQKRAAGERVSSTPYGKVPQCAPMIMSNQYIRASVRPITALASAIAGRVGRPVIDQTGLAGNFDFDLQWSATLSALPAPDASAPLPQPDEGVSLFTALQEQLGLKLEAVRGPVEVVVIDHVEAPTPD